VQLGARRGLAFLLILYYTWGTPSERGQEMFKQPVTMIDPKGREVKVQADKVEARKDAGYTVK
jgi:hypothetical protein